MGREQEERGLRLRNRVTVRNGSPDSVYIYHRRLGGALTWAACVPQRAGKSGTSPSSHHVSEKVLVVQPDGHYNTINKRKTPVGRTTHA